MGARTDYPAPPCPRCGVAHGSLVKNTYYSVDGKILRTRFCPECGWKWWTVQDGESTVDMSKYKIHIPKFPTPRSRKRLQLIKLDENSSENEL